MTQGAALAGAYGLELTPARGASRLTDRFVTGQSDVRIRFKLAARSLTGFGAFWVPILQGDAERGLPIFALQMRPVAGGVQVRLAARRGFFEMSSDPIPLAPGTHSLEIVWRPGTEGATLALDGAPRASLSGLPARTLGQIAIGTPGSPIWRGGTIAIDDYESTKA